MKTLIIATTNRDRFLKNKRIIRKISPKLKIEGLAKYKIKPPIENGENEEENARIKSTYYWKFIKKPVLSIDDGMYLENITSKDQPGIFIHRIERKKDKNSSCKDIFSYWYKRISSCSSLKCKLRRSIILYDGEKEYMQNIETKFSLKLPKYKDISKLEHNPLNHFLVPLGFKKNLFEMNKIDRSKYENFYVNKITELLKQANLI